MSTSRAFLAEIIDYAGLFPPACLSMVEAARSYAQSRIGEHRDLLGRFILPASRLGEFSSVASSPILAGAQQDAWRLSVIPVVGNSDHTRLIQQFNSRPETSGPRVRAMIDAVEVSVATGTEAQCAADTYGHSFALFVECAAQSDSDKILDVVASTGAAAKLRTGGIVETAFPPASAVIQFFDRCAARGVRFKATAGLHHALRGTYPLTYDATPGRGTMFGYLNLFVAATFHRAGLPEAAVVDLLEETAPDAISFDDRGASWRGNRVTLAQLLDTRHHFAVSFGSCSFTEPVNEAAELHLL